jgi:hypothetical protein
MHGKAISVGIDNSADERFFVVQLEHFTPLQ